MTAPTGGLAVVAVLTAAGAVAAALPPAPAVARLRRPAGRARGRRSASSTRDDPDRHQVLPRAATTGAVALGAVFLVGGMAGVVAGLLAGAACWYATGRLEPPGVRRRRELLAAAVPHVVDLMAACLTAGMSPSAAVEQIREAVASPAREELSELAARLRLGVDPATVWSELARHPQLGGLGRSVVRAIESGASVSEAMQRLADDLRQRTRADVESRARAVGVKAAVPLGICLLPAFILVGVVPLVAGSVGVLAGR